MESMLDLYVEKIIHDTEQRVLERQGLNNLQEESKKRGYSVITDEELDQMIGIPDMDILINAHIAEFDDRIFPHRHTFYELVCVYSGSFCMSIGKKELCLKKGDFILLNPSVIHQVSLGAPDSRVINILMKRSLFNRSFFYTMLDNPGFANFLLPSVAKNSREKNYRIYRNAAGTNPVLLDYLENLLREYSQPQNLSKSAMELNLSGLCVELTRSKGEKKTPAVGKKQDDFSIGDICSYLNKNLRSANLQETAAHFHYNPRYFSQIVKNVYGKGFSGLLLDLRMTQAAKLLSKTDLPVTQIIHLTGYENTAYFYRVFEQTYGKKPLQYRSRVSELPLPLDGEKTGKTNN